MAWLCWLVLILAGTGCHRPPPAPVFDIPSLVGKNIDEVSAALRGAKVSEGPVDAQQAPGAGLAQRIFRRQEHTLAVTFKPASKKVTALQLDVDAKTGSVKEDDKAAFLQLGNLKPNDPRYELELNEDPNLVFHFTSVKITPNPVSHKVTFRITGTEFMCSIAYSVRTNGSDVKTEQTLNVPKWETDVDVTVAATDDTVLTLQAMPFTGAAYSVERTPLPANFQETQQILVDGKVVAEAHSSGFQAICSAQL